MRIQQTYNQLFTDPYSFQGMEHDDEVKGECKNYTTYFRTFDPRLARWLSLDPIVHQFQSPYTTFDNSPILYVDPTGSSAEDIIIKGGMKKEAFKELQSSVESELCLSTGEDGKLGYTSRNSDTPLSQDAQQLVNAIDDKTITVNLNADDTKWIAPGLAYVGGGFGGNTVTESTNEIEVSGGEDDSKVNLVVAEQFVNPRVLSTVDNEQGLNGSSTLHEVTEAYQGALIAQKTGESTKPMLNAGKDPNSVYSKAHLAATPQRSTIHGSSYDVNGEPTKVKANIVKMEYYTPKGTILVTYP